MESRESHRYFLMSAHSGQDAAEWIFTKRSFWEHTFLSQVFFAVACHYLATVYSTRSCPTSSHTDYFSGTLLVTHDHRVTAHAPHTLRLENHVVLKTIFWFKHDTYLASFSKWLVALHFTLGCDASLLGESHAYVPLLNPAFSLFKMQRMYLFKLLLALHFWYINPWIRYKGQQQIQQILHRELANDATYSWAQRAVCKVFLAGALPADRASKWCNSVSVIVACTGELVLHTTRT